MEQGLLSVVKALYNKVIPAAVLLLYLSCGQPTAPSGIPSEMKFVTIPSGSFMMGSPEDEQGRYPDEGPLHEATISCSFELLSTEVTQSMWEEVMGSNPSTFVYPDHPVETVSWDDCQDFIDQLNLLDNEYTYRLPSEAEFEYACRAGTTTRFYSGDEEDDLNLIGWYSGNSGGATFDCGLKAPNAWGLYDMSGNVWEWCEDYYHDDYTGAPPDGSPWLEGGPTRVSRGGSSGSPARRCRSAARDECSQFLRYIYLGFRVVRY